MLIAHFFHVSFYQKDKIFFAVNNFLVILVDDDPFSLCKIEEGQSTETVSSLPSTETPNITNKVVVSIQPKSLQKIPKLSLTSCLSVLLLLNIIILVIYLSIVFPKLRIAISTQKTIHRGILLKNVHHWNSKTFI
jgi:hypothetical protein